MWSWEVGWSRKAFAGPGVVDAAVVSCGSVLPLWLQGSTDSTTITPGYRGGVVFVFPLGDWIYRLQMYHVNGTRGDSVALAVS